MPSTSEGRTTVSLSPPAKPRLLVREDRAGGWFGTVPGGLRTDLVTISPRSGEQAASAAMHQAAQTGNREHAPAILAAIGETTITRGAVHALAWVQRDPDPRSRRQHPASRGLIKKPEAYGPGQGISSLV
jgi:hypothetical protein